MQLYFFIPSAVIKRRSGAYHTSIIYEMSVIIRTYIIQDN